MWRRCLPQLRLLGFENRGSHWYSRSHDSRATVSAYRRRLDLGPSFFDIGSTRIGIISKLARHFSPYKTKETPGAIHREIRRFILDS